MFYRILRFVNEWFAIVVLWLFIGAFLLALSFVFLFPQVTLALFFLGLAALGVAVVASGFLRWMQRRLARRTMSAGVCPRCRASLRETAEPGFMVQCTGCATLYAQDGTEIEQAAVGTMENSLDRDRIV